MATRTNPLDLASVRQQFPLLQQHANGYPLAYLDSGATSQKPQRVVDAVNSFYLEDNANVHRGLYDLSRRSTERFENARTVMARFLNADPREVIWVRGTTEGVNLVAGTWGFENIRAGDEIIVSVLEHHSNLVPWQILAQRVGARIRHIDIDDEGRFRLDQLDSLLNERTRLVALQHVSNALGTIHPIADIADRVHRAGALLFVDGAQGAPHMKVDVRELGCDFYAFSGHKMCGPMGIGVLWGRLDLLEAMPPYHGGGDMIDRVELESSTWAKLPHKFEAGTPDAAAAIGLATAAEFLDELGFDALQAHEQEIVQYGIEMLDAVPGLTLYGPRSPAERVAVFSFTLDGVHPHDVATVLDAEGIAVRAGHHCAQPLMRRLGVPATTRASFYLYNTPEEMDRLVQGLASARAIFGG